jgi:acyl-CoA reductase-like NAD-dependent aldehyde dehydrogenase
MATQWAFAGWAETPVNNRVQILFRMKALVGKLLDELTYWLSF